MPIITPAYPSMCATHNVTQSTLNVMRSEFLRAAETADRIMIGNQGWCELFKGHDFFFRYKYYLQILASAEGPEQQRRWIGLVESRLRQLVMKLELVEGVQVAHPFTEIFEHVEEGKQETVFYVGLDLSTKMRTFSY